MIEQNPLEQMTELARRVTVESLRPHGLRPVERDEVIYLDEGGQITVQMQVTEARLTKSGAVIHVESTIEAPGLMPVTTAIPAVAQDAAQALEASLNNWNRSVLATVLAATGAMPASKVGVAKFALRTAENEDDLSEGSHTWEIFAAPVNVTTTGSREAAQEFVKQEGGNPLIRLMLHALTSAHEHHNGRYFALQVNVARRTGEPVKGQLLLNGEEWAEGRQALEDMYWPAIDGVLGVRQFMIIKRI